MKIPLFDEPDYAVNYREDLENYIMRKGTDKKNNLYWEEHNFKGKPINIAISNIPDDKIDLYRDVLRSIKIVEN